MIIKYDKKNKFKSMFNPKTGFYARTGILDDEGKDTGVDPFMTSYPELIDIGIMGHCVHGKTGLCIKSGVQCYQNGLGQHEPNMSLENYKKIIDEGKGKMFQCLEENEIVLVRNNLGLVSCKQIKDIYIGDEIFYKDNIFVKVTDKHEKEDEVYEIKLQYGKRILATKEHKFPTQNGLKTVEELTVGDILFASKSTFSIPETKELDIVKMIIAAGLDNEYYLTTCDGAKELADKLQIKRTQIRKSLKISDIKNNLSELDYRNAKITRERSQYSLNTYYTIDESLMVLLGHFIGNGSDKSFVVSKEQQKMIQVIEKAFKKVFPEFNLNKRHVNNICILEVSSILPLKILFGKIFECRTQNNEKQLPNFIFNVSQKNKLAFLRGYFCDGNIDIKTKDGNYGQIVFNTSSNKLAKDICLLLASMDVDYSFRIEKGKSEIFSKKEPRLITRKDRYRICVDNLKEIQKISEVVSDHKDFLRFEKMLNEKHNDAYLRDRKDYIVVNIKKIEGLKKVIDINVDSNNHLFTTSNAIISHNCALGGRGDVDQHENFEEILKYTRENGIVPNFTSSGLGFTEEIVQICKKYCGAVAISWYRQEHTSRAIQMLLNAGVKTNIHYVLGNNSIDEAIERLKNNDFPKGINAIIFLLHKPVGLGSESNVLKMEDPRVREFFELIDTGKFNFKIGFDSCTVPGIVNLTKNIQPESLDTCEGGRWSMYITSDMKALPCSFDNQELKWAVDLNTHTIQEAWDSEIFDEFRSHFKNSCSNCKNRLSCMGGCPIRRQIVLCNKEEKDLK